MTTRPREPGNDSSQGSPAGRSTVVLVSLTLVEAIGLLALSLFLFATVFRFIGSALLLSAILYLVASVRIRRKEEGVGWFVVAAVAVSVPFLAILTYLFLLFAEPLFVAIGLALIGIAGITMTILIRGRSRQSASDVSPFR